MYRISDLQKKIILQNSKIHKFLYLTKITIKDLQYIGLAKTPIKTNPQKNKFMNGKFHMQVKKT